MSVTCKIWAPRQQPSSISTEAFASALRRKACVWSTMSSARIPRTDSLAPRQRESRKLGPALGPFTLAANKANGGVPQVSRQYAGASTRVTALTRATIAAPANVAPAEEKVSRTPPAATRTDRKHLAKGSQPAVANHSPLCSRIDFWESMLATDFDRDFILDGIERLPLN